MKTPGLSKLPGTIEFSATGIRFHTIWDAAASEWLLAHVPGSPVATMSPAFANQRLVLNDVLAEQLACTLHGLAIACAPMVTDDDTLADAMIYDARPQLYEAPELLKLVMRSCL
jgi:hypothetical protein